MTSSPLPAHLLEGAAREGLAVAWVPIQEVMKARCEPEEETDPRGKFPWAGTVVSFALPYPAPSILLNPLEGRIAAFAAYDWYGTLKARLRRIAAAVREQFPALRVKVLVEGPFPEKKWAWRCGLGWIGKNSLLFHPTWGSRLLLGELLLGDEIEAGGASGAGSSLHWKEGMGESLEDLSAARCGNCRLCLGACPAGALEENDGDSIHPPTFLFRLRPERCLDSLTLHHPGSLPGWARSALGQRLVGCDVCQEVCPVNQRIPPLPARPDPLPPGPGWTLSIPSSLTLEEPRFRSVFAGHALGRLPFARFLRNCLAAAGNSAGPAIEESIRPFLHHPDPILADQASWSLAELAGKWRRKQAAGQSIKTRP